MVFRTGADHGDPTSMGYLGVLYGLGFGVTQDYAKAREWYEKAADKGYVGAMTSLGIIRENGFGVAQDYAKAREWYEKAADHGEAGATDYAKSREWFEKAARAAPIVRSGSQPTTADRTASIEYAAAKSSSRTYP